MPFSLGSYLLGVGTIAGALAFGVGSGVLMTKSVLKDTATTAQTRAERVARADPAPAAAPPVAEPKNPAPPVAATPPVAAAPALQADVAASGQPEVPKADTPSQTGEQPGPVKQGSAANSPEQKEAVQQKPAVRRVERPKHYAERRTRRVPAAGTRQWQPEPDEQAPAERPDVVYGQDEPRFGFFRTFNPSPYDRSDDPDRDR